MDRDLSDELTGRMPIVPHETAGADCCGCIVAVEGSNVELRCNECRAVMGVVHLEILKGLLGLDCATAACPHCGKENTLPEVQRLELYTCQHCGKAVKVEDVIKLAELKGTEIRDDTCTWYEFNDGQEPIAVIRCNRCGSHPNVDEEGVVCPLCPNWSPLRSDDLEKVVIEAWNEMVDPA